VKPESDPGTDFTFQFGEITLPALLVNMPTLIETHKTFDNKIFLKSGEIGQMLHVFENEKEREILKSKLRKGEVPPNQPPSHDDFYLPSGYTCATIDVVKKRFEKTRKNKPQPLHKIAKAFTEIQKQWKTFRTRRNQRSPSCKSVISNIIQLSLDF
jgi:TATA-binding protein-associated factor Taf7